MKIKRILTDSIRGVERGKTNPDRIYAVVYHGEFKILIPSEEAIYEPDDYRGQRKSDVLYYMLNKRMGRRDRLRHPRRRSGNRHGGRQPHGGYGPETQGLFLQD